jgi:hypothetical protein
MLGMDIGDDGKRCNTGRRPTKRSGVRLRISVIGGNSRGTKIGLSVAAL